MLTVSLHGIKIQATHGLYPQEHILHNDFEIDVDIYVPVNASEDLPYIDYTLIHGIVSNVFQQPGQLLETFTKHIHTAIRMNVPEAEKVKVVVRKMHPPLQGDVRYAQIQYEN